MTYKSEPQRALEDDIKKSLLDNPQLFNYLGTMGRYSILFEKMMSYGSLIADAVIFTAKLGIVGIEIKTEYDTLKRLPRQLDNYLKVCNYVFVYIHDSHLKAVRKLLKDKHYYNNVGIISYTVFQGDIIPGLYHHPKANPYFDLHYAVDILWKREIRDIMGYYRRYPARIMTNTLGEDSNLISKTAKNAGAVESMMYSRNYSKRELIRQYVRMFGVEKGVRILCEYMMNPGNVGEKKLKYYHFLEK